MSVTGASLHHRRKAGRLLAVDRTVGQITFERSGERRGSTVSVQARCANYWLRIASAAIPGKHSWTCH